MPSILTTQYRTFLANQFLDSLTAESARPYMFLGRPLAWSDPDDEDINDSNPPTPVETVQSVEFAFWRDMLGAKQVADSDAALIVARHDWTTGTIYAQYDDQDADLLSSVFYVLDTSALPYRVYKCLWNAEGAPSTNAPSLIGEALVPTATLDGYVWQYLYTLPEADYKFLTTSWMPVRSNTSVSENAALYPGKLPTAVPLLVVDGGSSYNAAVAIATTLTGDGSGATVSANGVTLVGSTVDRVNLFTGGVGYTEVPTINVYQFGSTPAEVRAIIPPYPNHGYDPAAELGARRVMLSVEFIEDQDDDLTVANNFRRIGLLMNPLVANGAVAEGAYYRQTFNLTLSANTGVFAADDAIYNTTKDTEPGGTVVDVVLVDTKYVVRITSVNVAGETDPFEVGDVIKCDLSGVEGTIESVSEPELLKYSGDIVYVLQRTPVARGASQTEEVKLVIPFG